VSERLYQLLPSLYRLRDAANGSPLRALLAVIDDQAQALETDIARLYENWFIETCDEWVVPYIADLLGVKGLKPVEGQTYSQRAYVANVLSFRGRKGTAAMLEQLAQDLTGWPAHAVEFFQLLATNQNLNHLRPKNFRTPDLHDDNLLGLLGGPFEGIAHTVDVRSIAEGRGRFNIQNVGLFLWRLESYPISGADASIATDGGAAGNGFHRFSPLGQDLPLFNVRGVPGEVTRSSTEDLLPGPLRRRAVYDALAASKQPPFSISVGGVALPIQALRICDLADWHRPPDAPVPPGQQWPAGSVAVDPLLGRIAFAKNVAPAQPPQVTYDQGFGGQLGGGGYPRPPALASTSSPAVTGGAGALSTRLTGAAYALPLPGDTKKRLAQLISDGKTPVATRLGELLSDAKPACLIEIGDSKTYSLAGIDVPANSTLELRAADGQRPLIQWTGDVTIGAGGMLILNGLLLGGATLTVDEAPGAAVLLQHTTLVPGLSLQPDGTPQSPGAASVAGPPGPGRFDLLLYRSITGPLRLPGDDGHLYAEDSIVDAMSDSQTAIEAAEAKLARATLFGGAAIDLVTLVSDVISTFEVTADKAQEGCVRFSFIPDGSRVPQPYRCQPSMALDTWAQSPGVKPIRSVVLARVVPSFTSRRYSDPGYAQLTAACCDEVRRGASDGGAMGAFNFLQEPQRETNLLTSLAEYLRFGLEAGILYVT
jgi:hypothetical protein